MQNRARAILTIIDNTDSSNRLNVLNNFEAHVTEVFTGNDIAELLSRFSGDEQIKIILKLDKKFLALIQKGDQLASVFSVMPYPNQGVFLNFLMLHSPIMLQNNEEIRQVLDVLSCSLHGNFLRWANVRVEELSVQEHKDLPQKNKEIKNVPPVRAASSQRTNSCFAFWQRCYRPVTGCAPLRESVKPVNHK